MKEYIKDYGCSNLNRPKIKIKKQLKKPKTKSN